MQDFHYNYSKSKYGSKAGMLLTDTDNLMYKVNTENVYKVFYKNKELFDFFFSIFYFMSSCNVHLEIYNSSINNMFTH